jgi:hypothetical protein
MKLLWKHKLDGALRAVTADDLPNSGFRSVYAFSDADAELLEKNGCAGFRGNVHSTELLIDCDTGLAAVNMEEALKKLELEFRVYSTGGRGLHFHVPRVAESGRNLPEKDKAFVKGLDAEADLSFYHHVGFYRCEGAVHQRTGVRKHYLRTHSGKVLDLTATPIPERPVRPPSDEGMQSVFFDRALQLLTVPHSAGERHARYVEIALALNRLNQPIEFAFAYLVNVNLMSEKPLPEHDCKRILEWAYYEKAY